MKQEVKSKLGSKAPPKKPKLAGSAFKQNEKLNIKFDDLGLSKPKSPITKQKISGDT
jgi:hypothetical protein